MADLNADNILDLAVANQDSNDISILLGNGDGTFQPQQQFVNVYRARSIAVGDLNVDGAPDLATGNEASNDVSVLLHR